jgi:hypothetical protein
MTVLHTEQWQPSVSPVLVHVAATAASVTSVWGSLSVVVCATITLLQTEQFLPAVKPVAVQVAATAEIDFFESCMPVAATSSVLCASLQPLVQ